MPSIHRIILYRLLAAWVAISLMIGVVVSWAGLRKIDRQLVTLATMELKRFGAVNLALLTQPETARRALDQLAAQVLWEHFIVGEFQDASRRSLASAVNPLHAALRTEVERQSLSFPLNLDRQFRKFSADGRNAMRVLVPLREGSGQAAAYFEGAFLVDPETVARLREDLVVTLLVALAAVTLTTLCLYPIILSLNRNVLRQSRELLAGNVELMEVVGSAVATRDSNTNLHGYRVALYAVRLGEAAGIGATQMRDLIAGAFLHDVGKIGVSDAVLLKSGPLDAIEFEQMKRHVALGVEILNKSKWLLRARDVVEFHHERYDGSGYPKGLVGAEIPLLARIFAVVDVFDALISKRPYKDALAFDEAMVGIRGGAGRLFDPRLVACFEGIAAGLYLETCDRSGAELEARLQQQIGKYFGLTV
ncbi:MAG: HD domain-containing protein [Rhodocyclales bacterium]|nr:HD domain-containing protein [Rhodocyclales bacterium]